MATVKSPVFSGVKYIHIVYNKSTTCRNWLGAVVIFQAATGIRIQHGFPLRRKHVESFLLRKSVYELYFWMAAISNINFY